MYIIYGALAGIVIGLIIMVIYYARNPEEWEKVNREAELEMQRKKRRKRARSRSYDDEIIGLRWMTNWQREKQRERIEWERRRDELDRYFRRFE